MGINKPSALNLVAMLSLWVTLSDFSVLTPALDALSSAFPTTPFSTILFSNTITGLLTVVVGVIAGRIIAKTGYRFMAIAGLVIATVSGCFPYLIADTLVEYYPIIISRILVGIGVGMVTPIGGAMISHYYEGRQRAKLFGIGNLVFVAGGVAYQLLGGFLASISWKHAFLGYLLGVAPLILVIIGLPEPPRANAAADKASRRAAKVRGSRRVFTRDSFLLGLPACVFGYVVAEATLATLDIPALFMTSTIVAELGMGTSAIAGVLTSLYQVSGVFMGLVFAIVLRICGRKVFSAAALVCSLSYVVLIMADNPVMYGLGMFLLGVGDLVFFTAAQYAANNASSPDSYATTNGLMMAAMNMGAFLASYYLTGMEALFPALGSKAPLICSAVLLFTLALVMVFLPLRSVLIKKEPEQDE